MPPREAPNYCNTYCLVNQERPSGYQKRQKKRTAAKKPQRKTSMLASGSMAVGIVEMPDLEPALEAPLANALAGCALLCRYGNHQPAGS